MAQARGQEKGAGAGSQPGSETGRAEGSGAGEIVAEPPGPVDSGARPSGAWKNRIVGQGVLSPDEILANPLNWRIHSSFQREAVEGALSEIGWIQQVIINRVTGHQIDGHLRVSAAKAKGEPQVPVLYVELTEEEEKLALATLDPLGALAIMDGGKLAELMASVSVTDEKLAAFMGGLRQDAGELKMSAASKGDGDRDLSPRDVAVKAVIIVSDLTVVEAAIAAAGHPVRGDALVAICRHFLATKPKAGS